MQTWIKGETVELVETTITGEDDFGQPIESEQMVEVDNVVVGEPSSDDVISEFNLSGKRIAFTLGIPKGDTHKWDNAVVYVRGYKCRTIGLPMAYTDGNMPSWWTWNQKVKVEHYE